MKLILIRSPQLFFYKMKSKKKIKNMTTDKITITITISDRRKAAEKLILKHICMKTVNRYYRKTP